MTGWGQCSWSFPRCHLSALVEHTPDPANKQLSVLCEWRASLQQPCRLPRQAPVQPNLVEMEPPPGALQQVKHTGFFPGRSAPQPWLVPGLCTLSLSSTPNTPARSNKSFQLILRQSLAHQDPPLLGSFCLVKGFCYFRAMTPLSPQGSEDQLLPNPSLTPHTVSLLPGLGSWGDHGIPE